MPIVLKLVFGIIGNATATALFLSPMPTFYKIVKKRSTEEFSPLPYVCTLFNCLLWCFYALPFIKPHSMLILTINGFGASLELFYIFIFLTYAAKDKKMQTMKWILAVVVAYSGVILVVLLGLHSPTKRQLAVGSACVVVGIAVYASPLSIMGMVIRTRSVEYMPFLLSLLNFLTGTVWSGYAIVTRDIFVAIPNGLGCLSGIAQLVLYAIYCNTKPMKQQDDEKQADAKKLSVYHSPKANVDNLL